MSPIEAAFVASIKSTSVVNGLAPKIRLISAGGEEITIVNHIKASVEIRGIDKVREHTFIVVEQLISQVILGVDFLQQQYLVLDFTTSPVSVTTSRNNYERPAAPEPPLPEPEALQTIRKAERERKEKVCIVTSLEDTAAEEVDEYAIPAYNAVADVEFPWTCEALLGRNNKTGKRPICKDRRPYKAGLSSDRHFGASGKSPTKEDTSTLPARSPRADQ